MKKSENAVSTLFYDWTFLKNFIQKNKKVTLITSYPGFDMVIEGHVSGDDKWYNDVYLFEKDAVFSFLDKMICECNKKTDDVFWITAR